MPAEDTPPPRPPLTFTWISGERRAWTVLFFTITAILFLSATFLLFQVVYPAARRQALLPQHVVLLDPSDPNARALLNTIADRDFALMNATQDSSTDFTHFAPQFSPSFKDFRLQARDFLETGSAPRALPRIFRPESPPLPPRPATKAAAPPPAPSMELVATAGDSLEQRAIAAPLRLAEPRYADATGVSWRIAVAASGQITLAVPLETAGAPAALLTELRSKLTTIRFKPKSDTAQEWGTLTLRWQSQSRSRP